MRMKHHSIRNIHNSQLPFERPIQQVKVLRRSQRCAFPQERIKSSYDFKNLPGKGHITADHAAK